jgi:tetratricopeptide (TPR) repeat protein
MLIEDVDFYYFKDLLNAGKRYCEAGKHKDSIPLFTRAIERGWEGAEIYYCRGLAYSRTNKKKLAIADYDKAIEIDPSYLDAYFEKASCLRRFRKFEDAIVEFSTVIKIDKDYGEAYFWRAFCYFRLSRFKEAIADFTIALNILRGKGYDARIFAYRGYSYIELGEWEKGIENLDKAISVGKENNYFVISDFKMRALAYEKLGNKEKAEEDFKTVKIIENRKDNYELYKLYPELLLHNRFSMNHI